MRNRKIQSTFCLSVIVYFVVCYDLHADDRSSAGYQFTYNGHACEVKHPDIRNNRIVFYSNLYFDPPVSHYAASDGNKISLNFKVFVADISAGGVANLRRLTKSEGVHEIDPIWMSDGSILYIEISGSDATKRLYKKVAINDSGVVLVSESEYLRTKQVYDLKRRASRERQIPNKVRVSLIQNNGQSLTDIWKLEGIIDGKDGRMAIINGKVAKIGDEIDGAVVSAINQGFVMLKVVKYKNSKPEILIPLKR